PIDFQACWEAVPDVEVFGNGFRVQWEMFLRHVAEDAPWKYDLMAGARGVQLAELGMQSWAERRWLDVPDLEA
ncbi:MAG: gfo/Idh/MocA family oxidoreductase, partial [bacterium]